MNMERISTKKVLNFDISADDDLTQEYLDVRQFAGGMLTMPAAWTAASIGFKVAMETDETFLPLYDHDGTLVQVAGPAVDCAYELPPEIFACRYVKLWSQDGSASNEAQAADRAIKISLKS